MGKKVDSFFNEVLDGELKEAVFNDFGKAVLRLPNQGMGEVREEVFVYFSAVAMQQINALAVNCRAQISFKAFASGNPWVLAGALPKQRW